MIKRSGIFYIFKNWIINKIILIILWFWFKTICNYKRLNFLSKFIFLNNFENLNFKNKYSIIMLVDDNFGKYFYLISDFINSRFNKMLFESNKI